MMKQKKCKCNHKSDSDSSFTSFIYVASIGGGGGGGSCGGGSGGSNNVDEKLSLSRQCANNWWKLKLADRKAHNELMKIQLLSPFLFCKVYQGEVWVNWAKKAGLLSQKRTDALDDLSDEEIQNTDLMELAITKLQEKIVEYNDIKPNNTPIRKYLEEILDDIKGVEEALETVQFDAAINKVYNKHWFKSVRKQLPDEKDLADKIVGVNDYAVFLVAWQVCFYMKSVYHEKPLDAYEKDSQLDSALEVSKQQGNEYFKNEEYTEAIKTYTTILCKKPYLYIIYGNRAACYLKTQEYRLALSDGRRAIALSPKWDKGQYRYAQALYALGQYEETLNVLSKAIKICSSMNLISLQRDVKKAMADGDAHILCANHFEPVSKNKENGIVVNGEEADEPYANMPELETDNSDNEGQTDHSDEEMVLNENKSLSPMESKEGSRDLLKEPANEKEKVKKKRRKKTKSQEISVIEKPMKIERSELITMMKEGSTYLLDAKTECAIREYRKVCCILQSYPDVISSTEIALLHYSLGWAYQESGSSLLQESLEEFKEINRKYPDMNFPLSYYGKGLVYHRQNRFTECIVELREALRISNIPDCVLNCCWAGVETIIEVSIPGNFKLAVEHFLNLCCHPPKPEAICRYLQCNYKTTNIYVTDPDFKGFLRLICTENCFVEFHSSCWKKYKSEKDDHPVEKDFLKHPCFTPDCFGAIWSLQIYDHSKNKKIPKEINVKDVNSLKKELEEAPSQKDLSERGREIYNKKMRKKDLIKSPSMDKYHGEDNLPHIPTSKEEKRRRRLSSMSDKDQESDDSPRMKCDESTNTKESKGDMKEKHSGSVSSEKDETCYSPGYLKDCFDISKYNNVVNDAKATAVNIFILFEKLLGEQGYVDTVNCPIIRNFLNTLDDNSKLLIVQVGSLRALLTLCPKFSFDEKNANAVYLTSQEEVYKESKRKLTEQSEGSIPKFEDPLFNEKLNIKNNQSTATTKESVPIKSRPKRKTESSDKDRTVSDMNANNEKSRNKNSDTAKLPCLNEPESSIVSDVTNAIMEEIDCTKTNENVRTKVSKNKKNKKNISDIIIFNDAKKGEEVEYKIISSPDPTSPRKKEKKKKGKARNKNEEVLSPAKHDRPSTPPGEKSKLRTYLEDKIDAEKNNKEAKYCCPLLGKNCSCAEIEKFRDDTAKSSNRRVRVMKVITIEPEGKESDTDDDDNSNALANVLELIQNKNAAQTKKRSSSCEQLCVVEVGIQCDLNNLKKIENEKESLKLFNEDLIKRLKESQVSNEKYTERNQDLTENLQAENKSHKAAFEKLRRELSLSKKVHQEEVKKLRSEQENMTALQTDDLSEKDTQIEELTQLIETSNKEKKDLEQVINDNAKNEVLHVSTLITKNEEIETLRIETEILRTQAEEMKQQHAQEKLNHEEIVNGLTNSVTEQSNRTQKVQIAFLEVKKEIVAVKYQQQAAIVQNTINQMQFWPCVPEIQGIRSVWDDFKKHFQSCYEKMQEEFKTVIQKVKDGQPLEDLPPAKYAEPPPFPKTPMPNNVPIPSPYYGQHMSQRMPNASPSHRPMVPSPVQTGPPGISIPQQRPPIPLPAEKSSDSHTVSSATQTKTLDDHTVSSVPATKTSVTSISKSSSEESVNVSMDNSVAAVKTDGPGTCVLGTSVSGTPHFTPSTSSTPTVVTSSATTSSTPKSSSIVTCETKTLSFASSVKGFGSDHQTFSSSVVGLKASAAAAEPSGFITDAEDSDIFMNKSGEPKNKMFDRIIMRLGSIFPSFTREELRFYAFEYRRMQPQGSLSGMKFDDLILNLEKMIRAMKAAAKQPITPSKVPSQRQPGLDVNQKKKSGKLPLGEFVEYNASSKAPTKRTRANHTPTSMISSHESSWSDAVSKSTKTGVFGQEEPCVICYEDMCKESISKLHCGHIFHRTCITCWLKEQRTCPICRVHALLPEEYPTLA